MNIAVLGSGGREHTLVWKIHQSTKCTNLYVLPGNPGTAQFAKNIVVSVEDFQGIKKIIEDKKIDLLVVGPEVPLVNGLKNFLNQALPNQKVIIIGPDKKGAQLEGSKNFSKEFMLKNNIPTAKYQTFTKESIDEAKSFLTTLSPPYVLKADGLAAGKGVIICPSIEEAIVNLEQMLCHKKFGEASSQVVIEDYLDGIEMSCFVLLDGKNHLTLPEAKDYKRIYEGDKGSNTGGMGAVSPVVFCNQTLKKKIEEKIIIPTINGLAKEKIQYVGFLFIGLMIVDDNPFVIEYNVRMGDPETQAVIPRIENDFLELLIKTGNQELKDVQLNISPKNAVTVVMTSGGYPNTYQKGYEIYGLNEERKKSNLMVFHAGTKYEENELGEKQKIVNQGGRVLAITALDDNLEKTIQKAYLEVEKIHWKEVFYRKDIGQDLLSLKK